MHEFSGRIPVECIQFMTFSFRTFWFAMLGQVTSYLEYLATTDWELAYRYHEKVLKLLQWKNPRRWVLKSPYHLHHLPTIMKVYPDAGIVWAHRDPVKAGYSAVSLAGTLNWIRSDDPMRGSSFDDFTAPEQTAAMLNLPIDWIESGALPKERLVNVQYDDVTNQPVEVMGDVYRQLGIPFTDTVRARVVRYVQDNPRDSRPAHAYEVGDEDEIAKTRAYFRRYQDYFEVPDEV